MGGFFFGLILGIVGGIILTGIAVANKWVDIEKVKEDQNKQS